MFFGKFGYQPKLAVQHQFASKQEHLAYHAQFVNFVLLCHGDDTEDPAIM